MKVTVDLPDEFLGPMSWSERYACAVIQAALYQFCGTAAIQMRPFEQHLLSRATVSPAEKV